MIREKETPNITHNLHLIFSFTGYEIYIDIDIVLSYLNHLSALVAVKTEYKGTINFFFNFKKKCHRAVLEHTKIEPKF